MTNQFTDFLFSRHLLVSDAGETEAAFETLFSLANLFNIRIVSGQPLAHPEMIRTAERCIGREVPAPFYRGFPQSVRALSPDALLFDQLLHYFRTYTLGDFSEAGVSLMEDTFQRLAFRETAQIREFSIITGEEALRQLALAVDDLLASTRPLSEAQYALVRDYIQEYGYAVSRCASRDTAVRLLLDTRDPSFAAFLQLSDVIRILEQLCHSDYPGSSLNRLNLRNRDRKFLTGIIDTIFREGRCNTADCFERKRIWNGLLHHIHYQPVNEAAALFVSAIRGRENLSVYSEFERQMAQADIRGAVQALRRGKGSGALLRKLTYILSRCQTEEDARFVLRSLHTDNPVILLQLIREYTGQQPSRQPRTFRFTRHSLLCVHKETTREFRRRRSYVSPRIRTLVPQILRENLEELYHGRLGRVYIAPGMERIAVPIQEATASGGYGVMPRGSRISIAAGRKIRCFTYWEKVNDIDLSVLVLHRGGAQTEFSWRTMCRRQSEAITFSGDQTSGYRGGSEYFDVDLDAFRAAYPQAQYLVFCNNVFSGTPFSRCTCTAGYMDRDVLDSGQVFEPKTVTTSFRITCESTFAYLFAIDLEARELVWLNVSRNSNATVAGTTSAKFLEEYFHTTDFLNIRRLFTMLAAEVVEDPAEADVVVSDGDVALQEDAEIIRSWDTERILALMNGQ